MSLGEKLRECRKMVNLTQEELAEKLCVSRQAITKWESDKGIPDIFRSKNQKKPHDHSGHRAKVPEMRKAKEAVRPAGRSSQQICF